MKITTVILSVCLTLLSCARSEKERFSQRMKKECLVNKNHEACEAEIYTLTPPEKYSPEELVEAKRIIRAVNPKALFNDEVEAEYLNKKQ